MIKTFAEFVESAPAEDGLRNILSTVCDVYSHWRLLRYSGILYQGKHLFDEYFFLWPALIPTFDLILQVATSQNLLM